MWQIVMHGMEVLFLSYQKGKSRDQKDLQADSYVTLQMHPSPPDRQKASFNSKNYEGT